MRFIHDYAGQQDLPHEFLYIIVKVALMILIFTISWRLEGFGLI